MSSVLVRPPLRTAVFSHLWLFVVWLSGKFWDLFLTRRCKEGYAPLKDSSQQDFYIRRTYGRVNESCCRPLAGPPGAWVDVMLRQRVHVPVTEKVMPQWTVTGETVKCLNLASSNYLGFGGAPDDPYCTPRVLESLLTYGPSMCTSRTEGGTTAVHQELEALMAEYLGVEDAIVYGMGFATNSSTIPTLVGPGCLVLSDANNHASIANGARRSGAKIQVFRHNDMQHLEALLRAAISQGQPRAPRPWKKILIVAEGTYSMEGELPPLKHLVALKKRYNAYLYLDEAHSVGSVGATGRGCCEELGLDPRDIDVIMGTLGKSYGAVGGFIAGSRRLMDHVRRTSTEHLYATAMPPATSQQVLSALHVVLGRDGTDRGARKVVQLRENAYYLRRRLVALGLPVVGDATCPIVSVMLHHLGVVLAASVFCLRHRLAVCMVGPPGAPLLEERMRLSVSAAHTRADLDYAVDVLAECADALMLRRCSGREVARQLVAMAEEYERGRPGPACRKLQQGEEEVAMAGLATEE